MALTKPAGEWRYEDLERLPDDGKRYEIIEGELYEMPSPTSPHAVTIRNLMFLIGPLIEALGGWLMTAPLDVFFRGADPVQPDMIVLLPERAARLTRRGVEGPPDLLIEVLSPSNRGHDLLTKRTLYARAGVREYWIVDPESRTIDVLTLDRGAFHAIHEGVDRGEIVSPLLGGTSFPIARIFARLDEIEDEQPDQ
jgi:Uma2 family endonuclease